MSWELFKLSQKCHIEALFMSYYIFSIVDVLLNFFPVILV